MSELYNDTMATKQTKHKQHFLGKMISKSAYI